MQNDSNESIKPSHGEQEALHGFVHFTFSNLNSIGFFFMFSILVKPRYFHRFLCLFGSGQRAGGPSFSHRTLHFPLLHHPPSLPNTKKASLFLLGSLFLPLKLNLSKIPLIHAYFCGPFPVVHGFKSTLGSFSSFLFLSSLQFSCFLGSLKSLESGRGGVRSVKDHALGSGEVLFFFSFSFYSQLFEIAAVSVFKLF